MAVIVKKNELERYLRSHKCNKTNILHIVRTLKSKDIKNKACVRRLHI